jgi:hypothetical protein
MNDFCRRKTRDKTQAASAAKLEPEWQTPLRKQERFNWSNKPGKAHKRSAQQISRRQTENPGKFSNSQK